ncbi:MAG: hypothetical protein ACTSW1_01375 [Candidatus Hodarchaeales archaeon]
MKEELIISEKFDIDYTKDLENDFVDTGAWINRAIHDMESLESQVNELREIIMNQKSHNYIDATPNDGFVIRILESYLSHDKWSDSIDSEPTDLLIIKMNELQDKRNDLIEKAIKSFNKKS